MSVQPLFIYALSVTLVLSAVANAKTQLVEQRLQESAQTEEVAYRTPRRPGFQSSYAPNQWHRQQWTA